jgi:hypothetical protein
VVEWLTLLLCIRDISGSNLGVETGYLDLRFSLFSSVTPGKYRDSVINYTTISSFHFLHISSFIYHPLVWTTEKSLNKQHKFFLRPRIVFLCEISSSHGGEYEVKNFFWDVLPCKIIVDRRFRGTCWLHHHRPDDEGSTYFWNFGRRLFYTAVHPRRQIWTSTPGVFAAERRKVIGRQTSSDPPKRKWGILPKAARHWCGNSSVTNDPFREPSSTQSYAFQQHLKIKGLFSQHCNGKYCIIS